MIIETARPWHPLSLATTITAIWALLLIGGAVAMASNDTYIDWTFVILGGFLGAAMAASSFMIGRRSLVGGYLGVVSAIGLTLVANSAARSRCYCRGDRQCFSASSLASLLARFGSEPCRLTCASS